MMDWLKEIFKTLPLDKISEQVGAIVAWWSEQVAGIPASELPLNVYVGGALLVSVLWYFIARMLPKPFGGMSWIIVISILLTPGPSYGDTGEIAPACVGVIYSILMKNLPEAAAKFLPIMMVMLGGFLLGFVWQLIREQIALNEAKKPPRQKNTIFSNPFRLSKIEGNFKEASKKSDGLQKNDNTIKQQSTSENSKEIDKAQSSESSNIVAHVSTGDITADTTSKSLKETINSNAKSFQKAVKKNLKK